MNEEVRPEEVTPNVQPMCRCEQNRELVVLVGNLYHEAEEHSRGIASLHEMLRALSYPIPRIWIGRLRDEYVRHQHATERNIDSLRALVGE